MKKEIKALLSEKEKLDNEILKAEDKVNSLKIKRAMVKAKLDSLLD